MRGRGERRGRGEGGGGRMREEGAVDTIEPFSPIPPPVILSINIRK